ncbi:MAG TPA: hypothetical protein VMV68_03040 [Spirochaetia bacterium]|nr:hypothetical protein [Spirochaetia bacterium]
MGERKRKITPEILRKYPTEVEALVAIAADRAVRFGLQSPAVQKAIHALAPELFLQIYYCKEKEQFLALFAPYYFKAKGEPEIGPLFEDPPVPYSP